MQIKQKTKHNYTSELELKSLLIRIKNKRLGLGVPKENNRINRYIIWHTEMTAKKYQEPKKRNLLKAKIKLKIVELSERTSVDERSFERFGVIILLMVKNIIKKPQFSGYTYKDDFYSDAVYKILKYLNNFDHLLISKITGTFVNAFAYISQIIHNSVVYIIITKKKDSDRLRKYIVQEQIANNVQTTDIGWEDNDRTQGASNAVITKMFYLETVEPGDLIRRVNVIKNENTEPDFLEIHYPVDYEPTFEEFNELKVLKSDGITVQREIPDE